MRPEIEQAVHLLQRADDAALEEALALLQNTVFSFSMRVCGQREDAEDTMQEVLLKSVPHLPKFDSPKALLVWLYKVAKNRCLMNRRRSKFAPAQELSLDELMPDRKELERLTADGSINPEAFAIRSEEAGRLREAIQRLPTQYRTVLVLRDMEGLTDDEVAEITGLRSGTVRVRLHRARLFVRKELMRTWKPLHARLMLLPPRQPQTPIRSHPRAAKRCSQNSPTISTSSWMIPSARNWNGTWTVVSPARCSWPAWKQRSKTAGNRPRRIPRAEKLSSFAQNWSRATGACSRS